MVDDVVIPRAGVGFVERLRASLYLLRCCSVSPGPCIVAYRISRKVEPTNEPAKETIA